MDPRPSSYPWPLIWCVAAVSLPVLIALDLKSNVVHWLPFMALACLNADRRPGRMYALPLVMSLLCGMDVARLTGWWPCDVVCQGGAHYQTVLNLSVIWLALVAHVTLTVLAVRDVRRGSYCAWTTRLSFLLAGVSLFFLFVAYQLDLHCPYCRAVHWGTVAALFCLGSLPAGMRWWQPLSWFLAGILGANAVFHHTAVPDLLPPTRPQHPVSVEDVARHHTAESGRTYGNVSAPRTLEVIIDLTCRHCAEQYRPLMTALKPAIDAKRVRVIVRHLVRPSQPASRPAAELVVAAATMKEHAVAMDTLLGSNPDAGLPGLTARLAEVLDPIRLNAALTSNATAITLLIVDDQQRIGQLGLGPRTPAAVLSEDGKVIKTWVGDLPVPAIVAALDGAL